MNTWTPYTKEELEELIDRELSECSTEQQAVFRKYSVKLKQYPIERYGKIEKVFVAAIKDNEAMYYEDVEEGWNFSPLPKDGASLEHWCNQDELIYALQRWMPKGS